MLPPVTNSTRTRGGRSIFLRQRKRNFCLRHFSLDHLAEWRVAIAVLETRARGDLEGDFGLALHVHRADESKAATWIDRRSRRVSLSIVNRSLSNGDAKWTPRIDRRTLSASADQVLSQERPTDIRVDIMRPLQLSPGHSVSVPLTRIKAPGNN